MAFSGSRLHTQEDSSSTSARPAHHDMLKEGLARSAFTVAEALARHSAIEGTCQIELSPEPHTSTPSWRCSAASLEAALHEVNPEALTALVTWLRANDVRQLSVPVAAGQGHAYSVHAPDGD